MIKCIPKEDMVLYIDEELSPEKLKAINIHINNCESCRKKLESFLNADNFIHNLEQIEPSEDFDKEFWNKIGHLKAETSKKTYKSILMPAIAACAAIVILIYTGFSITGIPNEKELAVIENIEFYQNLDFAANLDLLENWEVITKMGDNS